MKSKGLSDSQIIKFGNVSQDEINNLNKAPERGIIGEILPVGGAILGGIGGGLLGGAAGIETGPGAVLTGYAGGVAGATAGGAAGEAAQQAIEKAIGKRNEFSGTDIAKTGLQQGLMEAVGGPILSAGGKILGGVGETVSKAVMPTSKAEAGLLQAYKAGAPLWERALAGIKGIAGTVKNGVTGAAEDASAKIIGSVKEPITSAGTAFEKGLMGTESMIGIQAKRAATNLWNNLVSPALKQSEEKVNLQDFFSEAEKKIIEKNPELTRQGNLLGDLQEIKDTYSNKGVTEVTLEELQKLKEGWAKFVPKKAYSGGTIPGIKNEVGNFLSGNARNVIYSKLGDEVKQAYFDYGNLKGLQELGKEAMTGGKLKGGFGGFWNTIKDMALVPIGTVGGQAIYKVGKGIELVGRPGGRFLRDIIPAFGDEGVGKNITSGPMTSSSQSSSKPPTQ